MQRKTCGFIFSRRKEVTKEIYFKSVAKIRQVFEICPFKEDKYHGRFQVKSLEVIISKVGTVRPCEKEAQKRLAISR